MISSLQAALYARLDAQLAASVYDHVPQVDDPGAAADFPYVVIDDFKSAPVDTKDANGLTGTILIHTWSRYRGNKEIQDIQATIYSALHHYDLDADMVASGYGVSNIYQEYCEILRDPDTITRHGVQRFRIHLEPI